MLSRVDATLHGRSFIVGADGILCALNSETGRIEWQSNFRAPISTGIVIAAHTLYVGTVDGAIYRVEPSAGVVQSSYRVDALLTPRGLTATEDALVVRLMDAEGHCRRLVSLNFYLSERR